ncbi:MAG TPA: DUF1800 domain-containing protein [Tepidisphaeraceae bacterium]|jgi:hypothetical protein|nr:DUF1800 domain-containing protein [Tepidisphaeraceae bacterium]
MASIHPLLAPYIPSDSDPFDDVKAAHLLNRAGFGGTLEEIQKVKKLGPSNAVDWLLDFPDAPADEEDGDDSPNLSSIEGSPPNFREYARRLAGKTREEKKQLIQQFMQANRQAIQATVGWWLKRMAWGKYPLQEKLTFFWHGHFTTSAKDERAAILMWRQNELLRQNAAGNFDPFVRAISRDPAMLDYLNNNENRKAHPNENYARELMELFTLGIGNYTEYDIKQSARAFTGWGHDGVDFVYRKNQHDEGIKTFFGRSGNFDGDDILTFILEHPACQRFVAGEIFKYFAYDNSEPVLATALGQVLYGNHYELRPLLRTILTSRAFYGPQSIGVQIKCPVQLVVGTVRMLGLSSMPPTPAMESALNQMGQLPFMPPNVRGWPGGRMWINTSTLFIRYNTGVYLAGGSVPALGRLGRKGDTGRPLPRREARPTGFDPDTGDDSAEKVVDAWVHRLIQHPIEADKKQVLVDALDDPTNSNSVRKLVQLIVSMPEYQLC